MGSPAQTQKGHAICIPFPAQGHINPMLKLAILLHHKGFHITFVHTEYNLHRLLQSHGGAALSPSPDFHYAAIPDGLPSTENGTPTHDVTSICLSTQKNFLAPFNELIDKLNSSGTPVSCVISDVVLGFALEAAERIGVPCVMLQTASACALMCNKHVNRLVEKGFIPLKDESYLKNGYLETQIDWIPRVIPLRLKQLSHAILTTDPNDPLLDFVITQFSRSSKAAAIIINTFDELEQNVLTPLSSICPPIYTVGSLHLLINQLPANNALKSTRLNLWKEESSCLDWLDSKPRSSVIYVNFGSITVLDSKQLIEFAFGLVESKKNFLWIIRPDLVKDGNDAVLPRDFWEEIGDSGHVSGWSPQEEVLGHVAIGGFLTHCGWNSMVESLCSGVPMVCWPFFADQRVNCRYACEVWGIGMEIEGDVRRDEVAFLVRELLDGERGEALRKRAVEWREKAAAAVAGGGCSSLNLERLISEILIV